jgi:hypothetical protein
MPLNHRGVTLVDFSLFNKVMKLVPHLIRVGAEKNTARFKVESLYKPDI